MRTIEFKRSPYLAAVIRLAIAVNKKLHNERDLNRRIKAARGITKRSPVID